METQLIKSIPSAYFLHLVEADKISIWLNLAHVSCIYQDAASNHIRCKMLDGSTHNFRGDCAQQVIAEIDTLKHRVSMSPCLRVNHNQ